MNTFKVTFFGNRGSAPVSRPGFQLFGGATACVMAELSGRPVILDAGTGLAEASLCLADRPGGPLDILLSHPHLDHLLGLLAFGPLSHPRWQVTLHGPRLMNLGVRQQLERLMAPPLWPVTPESFSAGTGYADLAPGIFALGDATVTTDWGNHPGGALIYRLDYGGKSLVYATDFEHSPDATPRLEALARGCDLLVYDGQFSDEEYDAFAAGWGHSTWQRGAALSKAWGVKQTRLFHHSRKLSDAALLERERQARAINPGCAFARALEEITL